ncbi:hypothetical protein ACP70R_001621 [Stipagrostis hirtigluma subsp. patula]
MQLSYLRRALRPRPRGPPVPFAAGAKPRPFSSARPARAPAPAPAPDVARDAPPPPMLPTRPWGEALAAAQRGFCLPLAGRVLAASGTGNAAVSPAAVHAALALAAAGARGATRRQILQTLCGGGGGGRGSAADAANVASRVVKRVLKDRSTSGGPRLAFAASVWADASTRLSPGFVEAAGNVYGSEAKTADFKNKPQDAAEQINIWVKESTKGTVASLLPEGSVDQNTGLVLGSALYFRGRWLDRPDIRRTTAQKFNCLDGTCVEVPFVEYDRTRLFAVHDGFKVIKLPYQQGKNERKFSMYIFLPNAHDGLFELTKRIFAEPTFLEQHLPTQKRHVDISVPKFTISFQVDVKDYLKEMGLELPFLRDADFSDMVKEDDSSGALYLSDVLHRAIVEVTDKGIEETSVTMGLGKPSPTERFVADRPFFFVIREEVSGTVIFMGHVLDPSA